MINKNTQFKINVITLPGQATFVVVPAEQAPDVRLLFERHGIRHTMEWTLPGNNAAAAQQVIHIADACEPRQVQAILDRVA
jgi:hypothetical protein